MIGRSSPIASESHRVRRELPGGPDQPSRDRSRRDRDGRRGLALVRKSELSRPADGRSWRPTC
jgi:hypothetical protein